MATEKTKQLTRRLTSGEVRTFSLPSMTLHQRQTVKLLPQNQRPVLSMFQSHDGRIYAYDGVSMRVLPHETDHREA